MERQDNFPSGIDENLYKLQMSIFRGEIWTQIFPNTKQEYLPLDS